MASLIFFAVLALLSLWAVFWVIRLAVRYGVDDAIRLNEELFVNRDHTSGRG